MTQHVLQSPRRNLHPADELGELREKLRHLRARETELRQQLLDVPPSMSGSRFDVAIRTQRRRVFLKERLPQGILDQPELWETRVSKVATVSKRMPPAKAAAGRAERGDDEDFAVIEPF